jgi:FKBP-type peptidyl-prolyl cis-trans isomerase
MMSCGKSYTESDSENLKPKQADPQTIKKQNDEAIVNINKVLSEKESKQIRNYIERRQWQMKVSDGVFIQKTLSTQGKPITDKSLVVLEYTLSLIDGTIVYSSAKDGVKKIRFGSSDDEPVGLLYALRTMRMGDEANVIVPSYLGYGLYGDRKKIKPHQTLIYTIKIKDVKQI